MNPHAKIVQRWSNFFVISYLLAIFIDLLFFLLLSVWKENKCIRINWPWTKAIVCLRSFTDFINLLNMILQFRLAYVAPDSRVVGAGDLGDQPKKIARNYLHSCRSFVDLFIVLPLPQYVPRLFRFLPLLGVGSRSPTGLIFESAWANFVINLFMFMLAGHVVGSCWYLFGLQRVNQCLRNACSASNISHCSNFIDCGHGEANRFDGNPPWLDWKNNLNATACVTADASFDYGIYKQAIILTALPNMFTRYIYSLFWGFQIITLAGNQVPSNFIWEVLFTMVIMVSQDCFEMSS